MISMSDYIVECLVCESMSYEIEESSMDFYTHKVYECEKCGFQWEIVELENGERFI